MAIYILNGIANARINVYTYMCGVPLDSVSLRVAAVCNTMRVHTQAHTHIWCVAIYLIPTTWRAGIYLFTSSLGARRAVIKTIIAHTIWPYNTKDERVVHTNERIAGIVLYIPRRCAYFFFASSNESYIMLSFGASLHRIAGWLYGWMARVMCNAV